MASTSFMALSTPIRSPTFFVSSARMSGDQSGS